MNQFDETYYVKDAWSQWNLGYPATWPEDAERALRSPARRDIFTTDPAATSCTRRSASGSSAPAMAIFGADSLVRLAHHGRAARHRDGPRAVLRRAAAGRLDRLRLRRGALLRGRRSRDRARPGRRCSTASSRSSCSSRFWFVLLDRQRHHERLHRRDRGAHGDGSGRRLGTGLLEPSVAHRGGCRARRGDGREVVRPLRHRGGRDLPRGRRRADPAQGRRLVLADGCDAPPGSARASSSSCPSPSSCTSRRGPAGSSPTAATTGTPRMRHPGDRASGRGCRCRCRACGSTTGHVRLERGPDLAAQLREPRVAVAAPAAPDLDVLPGLGDRRERLLGGRQRLPENISSISNPLLWWAAVIAVLYLVWRCFVAPRRRRLARAHRRHRHLRAVAALPRPDDLPVLYDRHPAVHDPRAHRRTAGSRAAAHPKADSRSGAGARACSSSPCWSSPPGTTRCGPRCR